MTGTTHLGGDNLGLLYLIALGCLTGSPAGPVLLLPVLPVLVLGSLIAAWFRKRANRFDREPLILKRA